MKQETNLTPEFRPAKYDEEFKPLPKQQKQVKNLFNNLMFAALTIAIITIIASLVISLTWKNEVAKGTQQTLGNIFLAIVIFFVLSTSACLLYAGKITTWKEKAWFSRVVAIIFLIFIGWIIMYVITIYDSPTIHITISFLVLCELMALIIIGFTSSVIWNAYKGKIEW